MLGPPMGYLTPPKPTHSGDSISPHAIRFCDVINRGKYLILLFWVCTWVAGAFCYKRFTDATDSSFTSASDSPSGEAITAFNAIYGAASKGKALMTLMQSVDGTASLTDSATNLDAYNATEYFALALQQYATDTAKKEGCWANSTSYYSLVDSGLSLLAAGYASNKTSTSAAGSSTFIYTLYTCNIDGDFLDDMKKFVADNVPSEYATGGCTGIELFQKDTLDGVEEDLSKMDRIVLPMALIILAMVLGNLPLMIVPILTILTTICIEFTIMYPVALSMQVVSFTPSVMMSLTIAMSIDYSLFLLSRASEQIAKGNTVDNSIKEMVTTAGHTIIASGTTLCFCFIGMLFFPMDMLKSVGIGASVSILMALAVNLTLTPALLYTPLGEKLLAPNKYFAKMCCARPGTSRGVHSDMVDKILSGEAGNSPSSYGPDGGNSSIITKGIRLSSGKDRISNSNSGLSDALLSDVDGGSNNLLLNPAGSGSEGTFSIVDDRVRNEQLTALYDKLDEAAMYESIWYKMGLQLLVPSKGIFVLLVVIALMTPVIVHFVDIQTSIAFDLMLPSAAPSLETYQDVSSSFGAGQLSPYKLLFDGTATNTPVQSVSAFATMQVAIKSLQELDATSRLTSFSGIVTLGGAFIPYDKYEAALACGIDCPLPAPNGDAARAISVIAESLNNEEGTATYVSVTLNVDPFSPDGTDWLVDARKKLNVLSGVDGLNIYLVDGAGSEYDAVDAVYQVFPTMIAVTLSVVFILMGCFFKSIVVPIRSVISICLTLGFVFGLSVLVYQDGAFGGLGLSCVSQTNQIAWLPPVMTFSIIVGLGLDYDVFLISRVLEFRLEGFTDDSAVLKGLYKTGGIITAAGIIMAVAFSGLLLSGELILNQTAFMLVVAVLIDTFVVRTVLVPILMGLTGTKSWWPRNLPLPTIDLK